MLASAHHSLSESAGRICPQRPRLAYLRGRDVTAHDGHAVSPVMVVNQAFVDRFRSAPQPLADVYGIALAGIAALAPALCASQIAPVDVLRAS